MIYRSMYAAYRKDDTPVLDLHHPDVTHLAVSCYEKQIFVYIESRDPDLVPEDAIEGELVPFPNGALYFRMTEVFHYSTPWSEEHWSRGEGERRPFVRVNYLNPECTASYVFYHYQFQEENPGMVDKYGVLYMFGNLLVLYHELPFTPEEKPHAPSLSTHNTPVGKEAWDDMIEQHFIPWEDEALRNHPNGPWLEIKTEIFR